MGTFLITTVLLEQVLCMTWLQGPTGPEKGGASAMQHLPGCHCDTQQAGCTQGALCQRPNFDLQSPL